MLKVKAISALTGPEREAVLTRSTEDIAQVLDYVRGIVARVKEEGDPPVLEWHRELKSDIEPQDLIATEEEIQAAFREVDPAVIAALECARDNIRRFHQAQQERPMWTMENSPGVILGRMSVPLDSVGCYVPGGTAAYPSSVLMTVIPAKVAGVGRVVVSSPPGKKMRLNPATLAAARIAGADLVIKAGGPFAVAALAYGTATIPRVDKIVGPGNKYVTAAKLIVFGQVDIDSPAGPSEALILCDETAEPKHMALDFLSQVEHDPDAGAVLISTSARVAKETCRLINQLGPTLERQEQLSSALSRHSHVLLADSLDQAIELTNEYAAEHLQIVTQEPWAVLPRIRHAGSIFMGPNAPVPVGDYVSGTNHVLPTGRMARVFSGLSVDDFIKKPTFQYLTREGLAGLRETVETLARAEGLPVHAMTVRARFEDD